MWTKAPKKSFSKRQAVNNLKADRNNKIIEESKKNSPTPKIKKTSFKNTSHKFKVNTALIFNQKAGQAAKSTDSDVNIEENTLRSGVNALFKVIEDRRRDKKLFEDVIPIFLHFSSIKIGKTPSRTLRIPLKHSLLTDASDICLITDDAKGFRKEFEKSIEHYENFLKEKDITNIKTIMPFYQLKTEYSEFELKRKLVELYDIFLVDAKISGYVVKKLGKIFMEKRKLPIPIRLTANKLKDNIDFALRKTSTNLHPNGDNFAIQVGHSEMTADQICENIREVCLHLDKQFPGGWDNIRGLNLKTPKSLAIPIYYTLKQPSEVPVPVVKAKRPKAYKTVSGELSTAYDKVVEVTPSGDVTFKQTKKKKKQKDTNVEKKAVAAKNKKSKNTKRGRK